MYEGERIREKEMFVELGGPKMPGFELVQYVESGDVEDYRVTLLGPDIKDMKEGERYPYAMIYRVAGEKLEKDLEPVIERRHHEFQGFLQGYMHLNQRYDIWIRISKDAIKRGLSSLKEIAKATIFLYKSELPFIEKMEAIYITDGEEVRTRLEEAMKVYKARDERIKALHDEDVEEFYSCLLCQSFAPTNVCIIAPDRVSLCGSVTWFDARAGYKVDPDGPNSRVPKGECLDPVGGEYRGVNEFAAKRSSGAFTRIKLYSFFEYPHTSCGCFEVIGFYIPEVEGIGFVGRDFTGITPNGLPFSTMAAQTGGGKQSIGFIGIGIGYFSSPKFLQADGGYTRVVWMPKRLKERVKEGIPEEMFGKIATEDDVSDLDGLRRWLLEKEHPVVKLWKREEKEEEKEEVPEVPVEVPVSGAGIRIVLKNAKITIDKVIVKRYG